MLLKRRYLVPARMYVLPQPIWLASKEAYSGDVMVDMGDSICQLSGGDGVAWPPWDNGEVTGL